MNRVLSCRPTNEAIRGEVGGFAAVIRYYGSLRREIEQSGGLPYRLTALGAWAASRPSHVRFFFREVGLNRYRHFVDLGSGDGIVTCIAALFTRATGIEIDRELCSVAGRAAQDLNIEKRADFICGDYLTQNLHKADCLYIYPDKPVYELEKALDGWAGTLLIYGPHFSPVNLKMVQRLDCGKESLTVYRNPDASRTAGFAV